MSILSFPTSQFTASSASNTASAASETGLAWHLKASTGATYGINAASVWGDYTGRGIKVGVFDDGVDRSNSYLSGSVTFADGVRSSSDSEHGTAVAGIIGADRIVGSAAVGIAYDSVMADRMVIGLNPSELATVMADQKTYDVVNHSWGWGTPFKIDSSDPIYSAFCAMLKDGADYGRGGLGTAMVVAAGNFRTSGLDTNACNFTNDRHVITVSALTSEGAVTTYASAGASVLLSGVSRGGNLGGITTTDIAGAGGYTTTDINTDFGGTSAATPEVSGVIALMLEANSALGWRDIKEILAYSAQSVSVAGTVTNGADTWNGGGMNFSNNSGFGIVDAHAAVRLAETWFQTQTSANEQSVSAAMTTRTVITDNGTTSFKFNLAAGIDIETVELFLNINHTDASQVSVQIVSPDGTVSDVLARQRSGELSGWTMTSNAFLGEHSGGEWTVKVSDGLKGTIGAVTNAELRAFGSTDTVNETFVFTDDYSKVMTYARAHIDAQQGEHTFNAAAVTSGSTLDLVAGTYAIDGVLGSITAGTDITRVFTGDGNDHINGSNLASILSGGRGNDVITGGAGDDLLAGGQGNDVLDGKGGIDTAFMQGKVSDWTITGDRYHAEARSADQTDVLVNVERVAFSDGLLAFDTEGSAGYCYRIYEAAFNRTPDEQGLSYWVKQMDKGMNVTEVAARFIDSAEFAAQYGAKPAQEVFVDKLYHNILDRAPDQGGYEFWLGTLKSGGYTEAEVLARFSDSFENRGNVDPTLTHGTKLTGTYFAF